MKTYFSAFLAGLSIAVLSAAPGNAQSVLNQKSSASKPALATKKTTLPPPSALGGGNGKNLVGSNGNKL